MVTGRPRLVLIEGGKAAAVPKPPRPRPSDPHAVAVVEYCAAFLELEPAQQAAALAELLERVPAGIAAAAVSMTDPPELARWFSMLAPRCPR